jgi:(p)ppGpp synthase/HD superfamily hydrolase
MNIAYKARVFARAAHGATGQKRKYTGEPYFNHPASVAGMVANRLYDNGVHDEAAVAAAYLHDVVEDTAITLDVIVEEFGAEVAELVLWMTEPKYPEKRNRAARKAAEVERWKTAPPAAKSIKLADLNDNTPSIVLNDPGFGRVYVKEKRALLESLKGGDPMLWDEANSTLGWAEKQLSVIGEL